jgi:hypothetical protein
MKNIQFCKEEYPYPSDRLGKMRDSNNLLGDANALKARIQEDGYLFFRGLIDRNAVVKARMKILQFIDSKGKLAPGTDITEGIQGENGGANLMGNSEITHSEEVKRVFEGPELFDFFELYFGEEVASFDYKWLRSVNTGGFTGIHIDNVYMGMGSPDLHTTWVPFGDIDPDQGTLTVAEGSHHNESFEKLRNTYGKIDVDRDKAQGWYSRSPEAVEKKFNAKWKTSEFKMGDVVIFGMSLLHTSTTNTTKNLRLSADIRFQPKSHVIDERWVGLNPKAHGYVPSNAGTPLSKEELEAAY